MAALAGGVLGIAGGIFNSLALHDTPRALFVDSLRNVARPGEVGTAPSIHVAQYQFFHDHIAAIIIGALLLGLASLAASGALTFLVFAARHRLDRVPRFARYLPFVGGALVLIGSLITSIGSLTYVNDLLGTSRTVDALNDASQPPGLIAGQIIVQFGGLALAGAYVLASLNAMRVGLLTRAMGVIGIIVGLLVVLPVALLSQLLQPLWLFALTWLLLDRWPGGSPPAWRTGQAEPWPSAAQQRQRREQQGGGRRGRPSARVADAPAPEPDPEAPASPAS